MVLADRLERATYISGMQGAEFEEKRLTTEVTQDAAGFIDPLNSSWFLPFLEKIEFTFDVPVL
jgi:hypothetical protein